MHDKNTEGAVAGLPGGVSISGRGLRRVIRARAGAPGWQPVIVTAFLTIWTAASAVALGKAIAAVRAGEASVSDPAAWLASAALLVGAHLTALCLWTMFGRETLVLQGHSLWMGTPWLFGFPLRRYDLRRIGPFVYSDRDCGAQAEGCCCRWSAVKHQLAFTYAGRTVHLFSQLPRETKERLREILENARREAVEKL